MKKEYELWKDLIIIFMFIVYAFIIAFFGVYFNEGVFAMIVIIVGLFFFGACFHYYLKNRKEYYG